MKKIYCALFLCLVVTAAARSQSGQIQPWGIWNIDTVDVNGPRRGSEETGWYYLAGTRWIWIFQSADSDYPVFYYDGDEDRIEKYERTTDGFLFYLIGDGSLRDPITNKIEFRDNTRIKVKMAFISQDECVFDYPEGFYHHNDRYGYRTGADKDGYRLQNTPRTDTVYRRYPVKNGAPSK